MSSTIKLDRTLVCRLNSTKVDVRLPSSAVVSCMASERNVEALATIINRREARGHVYEILARYVRRCDVHLGQQRCRKLYIG